MEETDRKHLHDGENVIRRIALIGSGRVATHLGQALREKGYEVLAVGGRTRLAPIPTDADAYIISVTDASIAQVAQEIGDVDGLVVHTAGSVPIDVLPQRRRGVLYPMQTFSKDRPVDFRNVPLFIESDQALPLLRSLAESLSQNVTRMDGETRRYLHLAAVFCCNFSNHMYAIAERILARHGIPFQVMLPLIQETAQKVETLSPRQAQTGPAVRFDQEVMQRHLDLIDDAQTRQLYELISQSIHDKL